MNRPILHRPAKPTIASAPQAPEAEAKPQKSKGLPLAEKPSPSRAHKTKGMTNRSRAPEDASERLSKRIMQLASCSRSQAEQYIVAGWVKVDGVCREEPMHRVAPRQTVQIDPEASLMDLAPVTLVLHKSAKPNARSMLQPESHWVSDPSLQRLLKCHFKDLQACAPLEANVSGLVVYTQDWRIARKLSEDQAVMENEILADIDGPVSAESLHPIIRALQNPALDLPATKVSLGSSTPQRSTLRFAVKGYRAGLITHLCELAGLPVLTMRRIRLGRVSLRELPLGNWRYLGPHEKF